MKASLLYEVQTHPFSLNVSYNSIVSTNLAHFYDTYLFCDNYASSSAICCAISPHFFERNVEPLLSAVSNSTVSPHTLCDKRSVTPSFYIQAQAQVLLEEGIKVGVWCC